MPANFTVIKQPKVSQEIVVQIKSMIKRGDLKPGEKLPSERQLAGLLGVGRSSLREAVNTLETLGFIEIKKRKGIFVRSVSATILNDPLLQILEEDQSKLPQLYELRKDIEMASSYWAAERRSQTQLAQIKSILQIMEKGAEMEQLSLKDDLDFHLTIAQASQNFLRIHILNNIFEISDIYIDFVRRNVIQEENNIALIYEQHEAIFKAIETKNSDAARTAMGDHLNWVNAKIRGFMPKQ